MMVSVRTGVNPELVLTYTDCNRMPFLPFCALVSLFFSLFNFYDHMDTHLHTHAHARTHTYAHSQLSHTRVVKPVVGITYYLLLVLVLPPIIVQMMMIPVVVLFVSFLYHSFLFSIIRLTHNPPREPTHSLPSIPSSLQQC